MKPTLLLRAKSLRGLSHPVHAGKPSRERGFAYLMALFMILAVVVASQVAVQSLLTSGRREREEDMIWRGRQYTRAIRLYYRKAGHYPKDLEDLQKGLPNLHFLRSAAYKDPMSTTDGEWGFIYINPTGQLIGSSRYASLQQMALMDLNGGKLPTPAIQGAVPASSLASPTPDVGSSAAAGANPASPGAPSSFSQAAPGTSPGSNLSQNGLAAASLFAAAGGVLAQKPTGPVDGPVLGAFLTGVVSKSPRASLKVYSGGKKYNEWEFIWNPLEDQALATQQGLAPQSAVPGQSGQSAGGIGNFFGPAPGQGSASPLPTAPGATPAAPQPPSTP